VTTSTRTGTLAFWQSHLAVSLHDGAEIDSALSFLESHFTWTEGPHDPDHLAHMHVYPPGATLPGRPAEAEWEDVYVRKSASAFFSIAARRTSVGRDDYIDCVGTGTAIGFHPEASRIDVVLSEAGYLDLVELIRDLVLKDQENRGALVLHATSAAKDAALVLISGSKGAGKSTVLLELVEHFGYTVVAGDKSLAVLDDSGDVQIMGWPDYPHLGFGTIDKYHGLRQIAGIADDYEPAAEQAFSPYGKFAVDFIGFRTRFPSAARGLRAQPTEILLPNIGPGGSTEVHDVGGGPTERIALLRENVESAFAGPHATWQTYLPDRTAAHAATHARILEALSRLPMRGITGPGDLDLAGYTPAGSEVGA
jgi:hypothetical protein